MGEKAGTYSNVEIIGRLRSYFAADPTISAAYLFGSRANTSFRPDSDIDVAIILRAGLDSGTALWATVHHKSALEDAFSPLTVDVIDLEQVPARVAHEVLKTSTLLAENDPDRRVEVEVRRQTEYLDFSPRLKFYRRAVLGLDHLGVIDLPDDPREARHKRLVAIAQTHGLRLVYLFGSQSHLGIEYLEGRNPPLTDPLADLDIGVVLLAGEMPPLKRADLYGALSFEFQDLFQSFSVDLVLLEETHSVIQAEAICGTCIYAESEQLREDYEERILARAADFGPFLTLFHRERLEERYDKPDPH